MPTSVILLAAGQGSRMRSDLPKVLHPLAGAPLIAHALASARGLDPERVIVVTGVGAEEVDAALAELDPEARSVRQPEQRGTGDAVRVALPELEGATGDIVVLYGDTPFIRPETLEAMIAARAEGAAVVILGFEAAEPGAYGRLILDDTGDLLAIVEAREATEAQLAIRLCNCGVVAADAALLPGLVAEIRDDNAKGEFYLTDIVALARNRGLTAKVIVCDEAETLGVNSRADLAAAEAAFQARARSEAMENGVTLTDPATVWFAHDTHVGRDTVIGPNVFFGPGVTVESGAEILPFCHLEGCHVSRGSRVGPFARLRPGAELAEHTHVGNFVEIKNAIVDEGAKINHLTYVGDGHVGARTNIGAGTIFCNYDGVFKHHTEVGADVFIGSNSALVAPVRIGDGAMVGAGSTVTEDVPAGALAVARGRQSNKAGLGTRLMSRLRALKSGKAPH
ncbi:bifunctional UDP-N-acetylglucosamine diphosphorylase/glucosamine-1-phosphate N-acetyltransferase GlmU [Amaricoccus solimangrovi]|uniref:Bifunctional protein GlmU n=1 Tax=Amaricoccus solimangrovi TaxID=2589815 RepID=A0A501WFB9_9RHOB|nr:bifunctional UDP-N-acetylglucosamine diphosphorylase/glucosamine-1-phosphate N-acetyltransferase GlmU [Amaricoccus solimangrovi]TPE48553.1 bifunctional UDP-N-acetylglucosamine diphosphorylase/glucosamine-1-phosphate N-acetyltransferase GlmU [Amaricoccus solimangrovi]